MLLTLADLVASSALVFSDGYRTKQSELGADGFPILRVSQIGDGRIEPESDLEFVRGELEPKIGLKLAALGDAVVTTKGTIGRRARVRATDPVYVYSPQVCFFRTLDAERLDDLFLYYWLGSLAFARQVDSVRGQTDMADYVSLRDLAAMKMELPDISSQRAIGSALAMLDDKIDVNRHVAETLEEIARTLFKSWFVDFDPVNGTVMVPDDVRRLFPERLVGSSIGLVPEDWEVAPLGEHVDVTRGLSYTGAGLADEGMPLHNLNSIREGGGYKEDGIKHYVGEHRERDRVRAGDLIVANTDLTQNARVIGYPAIIPRVFGDDSLYSQDLCRVRARDGSPLTSRYLYLLLASTAMRHQVASYANGTTVLHLAMDGLKKPPIAVPSSQLLERFDEIVGPMFEQQQAVTEGSKTLADLRNMLLPKLMSGEIRLGAE
jgi:type I restriction enzyme S subunit